LQICNILSPRHLPAIVAVSVLFGLHVARGQAPSQIPENPTPVLQPSLSGMQIQQASVSVTQRTINSGGGNTVDVISSSVGVSNRYAGSTPSGVATKDVLPLTLEDALKRGLRFNLGVIDQNNQVLQAEGQRMVARSQLMPTFNTAVSEEFEQLNLRTQGVESNTFPLTARFNFFDARAVRLDQTALDFVRLDNLHSASAMVAASREQARDARDLIVLAVGGSYLQLIATQARIDAANAEVDSSRAIYKQAADRFAAGLNARIDANRAQVQLQTEQQRLRSLQADLETQKLRLARIIGLPVGQQFTLVDVYGFAPLTEFTIDTALARAFATRTDLRAAAATVKAAEESAKAAHAEYLPTLKVNADVGAAGVTPSHESSGVFTVAGTLNVPLYEGGRIRGEVEQTTAALKQRQAELEDLRAQVDQDVRQAFINLNSAADQVGVAKSNVDLAHQTLTQSTDRFNSGVADTVELVQAEQAVVQADADYINAVFEHNLAKISLARAMGNAEQTLPQLLRK
jgi:outer membrane protein TolC